MKKIIALALVVIMALSIVGCGKKSDIPSLEDIKTNFYTDDELEKTLRRIERDDLIAEWGEPDRHIDHENEDVWMLDERKALVISYTLGGKVEDADIED